MKNNGSLIWMLLGLTQIFLMFGMWEELEGPMTTLFGSSGAAMVVLAGYFWIQEKRNNSLSELQGYNKNERTNTYRNEEGILVEKPIGKGDKSSLWITFSWFIICWFLTKWLF
ncbi:MAG: hypothetical protein QF707_07435 [Candidatus Poseidoniaceae archaeon]|jgi:hypothetical protein|nr:hypothetical protein [Candidatus Poseidoniaceae archaeon]MDP7203224.1 hypothetical protein [Candidatus Poseidoniaceae archaeon]